MTFSESHKVRPPRLIKDAHKTASCVFYISFGNWAVFYDGVTESCVYSSGIGKLCVLQNILVHMLHNNTVSVIVALVNSECMTSLHINQDHPVIEIMLDTAHPILLETSTSFTCCRQEIKKDKLISIITFFIL